MERDVRQFSITKGGPTYYVLEKTHLARRDGTAKASVVVVFAWLPMAIAGVLRAAFGHGVDAVLTDLSVHVRLLITLPLVVLAERLLEERCMLAVAETYESSLADKTAVDSIVDRGEHLRDSNLVEGALFAFALLTGVAALAGLTGPTGFFHGIERTEGLTVARFWFATVGLPLVQFMIFRWLWRWGIWSYMLARLARLPLRVSALHPDGAAGLGHLRGPITAFSGFVLASATMISAAWATRVLDYHVNVHSFVPALIAFLVVIVILACAPLLLFSPRLYRTRFRDMSGFHGLGFDYARQFKHKWIDSADHEAELLGNRDIRAFNDLGGSFERVEGTGFFVFSKRNLAGLVGAAIAPMLPLVLMAVPTAELLKDLGGLLIGGK